MSVSLLVLRKSVQINLAALRWTLSKAWTSLRNCGFQIGAAYSVAFNSSPPSYTYMRQWIGSTLVQIMACRLFGAKPLYEPMLGYCQLDPIRPQWNLNQNTKLFIHETAAILTRGRWVDLVGRQIRFATRSQALILYYLQHYLHVRTILIRL